MPCPTRTSPKAERASPEAACARLFSSSNAPFRSAPIPPGFERERRRFALEARSLRCRSAKPRAQARKPRDRMSFTRPRGFSVQHQGSFVRLQAARIRCPTVHRGTLAPGRPSEPPSSTANGGEVRGGCLSRRSRRVPPRPPVASSAGESAAGRPGKPGRLLCLLSWRSKKEGRPPGRVPANPCRQWHALPLAPRYFSPTATILRRKKAICVCSGRPFGHTSWQPSRLMQPNTPVSSPMSS